MSLRGRSPSGILEPQQRSRRSEVQARHLLESYLGAHVYLDLGGLEDQTPSPRGDGQTPQSFTSSQTLVGTTADPKRGAGRCSRGSGTTDLRAFHAMSGILRLGVTGTTSLIIRPTVLELSSCI